MQKIAELYKDFLKTLPGVFDIRDDFEIAAVEFYHQVFSKSFHGFCLETVQNINFDFGCQCAVVGRLDGA